jgi:hypothetical protein
VVHDVEGVAGLLPQLHPQLASNCRCDEGVVMVEVLILALALEVDHGLGGWRVVWEQGGRQKQKVNVCSIKNTSVTHSL